MRTVTTVLGQTLSLLQVTNILGWRGLYRVTLFPSNTMLKKPHVILADSTSFLVLQDREDRAINVSQISSVTTHYDREDKAVIYIQGLTKPFQTDYPVKDIINALETVN